MQLFQENSGFVYVFENPKAKRVKVGKTYYNVESRLNELNQYWLDRKVTCQVCGIRLLNRNGYIPFHNVSGIDCLGGGELPLEKDVSIALNYLENLVLSHSTLRGVERGSNTRRINTLEKRIAKFRSYEKKSGIWEFKCAYYTRSFDLVETFAHKALKGYLDREAPLGEVFNCSERQATLVVERVLKRLGLLEYSRKIIELESL